jgi:hypothetical protein
LIENCISADTFSSTLNILHLSLTVEQIAGSSVAEINIGRGKTLSAYAMKAFGNIEE